MDQAISEDLMRCDGTIPDGLLAGKPCGKLLRRPTAKLPVKRCPRCHTEHRYGDPRIEAPVWPELNS